MKRKLLPAIIVIALSVVSLGAVIINIYNNENTTNTNENDSSEVSNDDHDHNHSDEDHSHDDDEDHEFIGEISTRYSANIPSEYFESYSISDSDFGTETTVTISAEEGSRTISTNALPNHETGEFPNSGNPNSITEQESNWTYPLTPVFTGESSGATVPGIAVNGVKFQPGTAERAQCENGVTLLLEAPQNEDSFGLVFNNAHVQPTGEYHYHGISELLVDAFANDEDLVHIGFAADGHMMYYSKSGAYDSSYRLGTGQRDGINCVMENDRDDGIDPNLGSEKDGQAISDWDFDSSYGDLDECNGITIDGEYMYIVTDEWPFVSRCLNGEFTEDRPRAGQNQGGDRPER